MQACLFTVPYDTDLRVGLQQLCVQHTLEPECVTSKPAAPRRELLCNRVNRVRRVVPVYRKHAWNSQAPMGAKLSALCPSDGASAFEPSIHTMCSVCPGYRSHSGGRKKLLLAQLA